MRAFVAIGLPEEVRASLKQLQRRLAESQADVKWVADQQLHITLKFLGEISDQQRQAIEAFLRRLAEREEPFSLSVAGVGAFPSVSAPRVIWVGCAEGREIVARIAQALEEEVRVIGLRQDERPVSPHLTLGRVRSSRHRDALTSRLRAVDWQPPAPWRASSLTLYQSVLSSAGPQYTVLVEVPLTK